MGRIFNQKSQNEKRRLLRNNATNTEQFLWNRLKGKQIRNLKFRRQFSIGKYVVDFYCPELKLAIEVDGETHCSEDEIEYDRIRQNEIENFGISFIRFKNEEIFENIEQVIRKLELKIEGM